MGNMSSPQTALEVFEREFLTIRAKTLELAAALDRIQRAEGSVASESRMRQIALALETLLRDDSDRAEQIQLIFSRSYDDDWEREFQISTR